MIISPVCGYPAHGLPTWPRRCDRERTHKVKHGCVLPGLTGKGWENLLSFNSQQRKYTWLYFCVCKGKISVTLMKRDPTKRQQHFPIACLKQQCAFPKLCNLLCTCTGFRCFNFRACLFFNHTCTYRNSQSKDFAVVKAWCPSCQRRASSALGGRWVEMKWLQMLATLFY